MTPAELQTLLNELRLQREAELKQKFDRSLPFADGLFDRWERARRLGFADGASIYDSAMVFGSVTVGANTWIGPNTLLDASGGGIAIGSHCSVSAGVHLYTHDTVLWALSGGKLPRRESRISIGDCVHIGAQSVIIAGVTVGSRCVIAANSLVNRDIADGTIVGGSPARVIGRVEGTGADIRMIFGNSEGDA